MSTNDQLVQKADVYPEQVSAFQIHAAVFAATMVLISTLNLILNLAAGTTGQLSSWWSIWALIGWGLGIAVHGFVVWLARPASHDHVAVR